MIYLTAHLKVYQHKGTTSSWLAGQRTPSRTSSMTPVPEVNRAVAIEGNDNSEDDDDEDEGYDGEESVDGTVTTERSESNSLGSLTSVD